MMTVMMYDDDDDNDDCMMMMVRLCITLQFVNNGVCLVL